MSLKGVVGEGAMACSRWSAERANAWYRGLPWLVGCNFVPSTAVNQLEMWQAETFDPETIGRELSWAADLGFNLLRVFLHDLPWTADPEGFAGRIDRFLALAHARDMRTLLVLFDDCWHPDPVAGPQPPPVPGVHNSRWVQSPGDRVARDRSLWGPLEAYVKGVIGRFGEDERVLAWDLYNEPGNAFLPTMSKPLPAKALRLPGLFVRHVLRESPSMPLLRQVFAWAREVGPAQPCTAGTWIRNRGLARFQVEHSDFLSFHHYGPLASLRRKIRSLERHGRPLVCTEYLARALGSRFETHLPVFRRARVGCACWGLVAGRTQTCFSWVDPPGTAEPPIWFHDILRADGTPWRSEEVEVVRREIALGR